MFTANENQTKAAVSVAEMARMVGLSRQRFYQLINAAFPSPRYDLATRRPFYDADSQAVCLDVRRHNCGIDGKPVLFYSPRPLTADAPARRARKAAAAGGDGHPELLDGLRGLGLAAVTAAQLAEALKQLYPNGVEQVSQVEVLRAVFLRLRAKNSGDNVGK